MARCPRCGTQLSYVPSTELGSHLSFKYCRSCGYVDVEEDFRRVRMPPNSNALLSWLERKSEETKKKEGVIGRGRTVRRDEEVVEVEAEVKREALRLSLDAVFYGGVLHVVRDVRIDESRCVEEKCPAVFELEWHEEGVPEEGELLFSEPAFLYDAAADILRSPDLLPALKGGGSLWAGRRPRPAFIGPSGGGHGGGPGQHRGPLGAGLQ